MFSFPSYTSGWTLPPLWLTTRSVVNLWLRAWPCLRCVAKTKNMTKRRRRTIIGVKAWTNLGVATRCSSFPSIQSPSLHLHLILGSMVILWLRAWPCKYDRAPRADHNYGNIRTPGKYCDRRFQFSISSSSNPILNVKVQSFRCCSKSFDVLISSRGNLLSLKLNATPIVFDIENFVFNILIFVGFPQTNIWML